MFFHISKTVENNFPHNHITENFVINLDEGWTHVYDQYGNDVWYKGYLDDAPLRWFAVRISEEQEPQYSGNSKTAFARCIRRLESASWGLF